MSDGTGTLGDADYVAPAVLEIVILAGATSGTISIPVNGDLTVESDETFTVLLATTSNGTLDGAADTGLGTITNDDAAALVIDDVTLVEGDAGTTLFQFTVTSEPSDE